MKPIYFTPQELVTIISHHSEHGANPASLTLATPQEDCTKYKRQAIGDAVTAKRANDFGKIIKHSQISAFVNFNYASNVNAQRTREGKENDFAAKSNWFEHVTPAIVKHKTSGELYVFVRVLRAIRPTYYTVNGVETPKAKLLSVLPVADLNDEERALYGIPARAPSAQGIEQEIKPIAIKLANVRGLTIDGFTYAATPTSITTKPESVTHTAPVQPSFSPRGQSLEDEVSALLQRVE